MLALSKVMLQALEASVKNKDTTNGLTPLLGMANHYVSLKETSDAGYKCLFSTSLSDGRMAYVYFKT